MHCGGRLLAERNNGEPLWLGATDYHIYAGSLVVDFPGSVAVAGGGASFAVAGADVEAEAAVYYGQNKAGVEVAWIFGFLADSNDAAKVVLYFLILINQTCMQYHLFFPFSAMK